MFARARMQAEVRDALVVAPAAIVRRGQLSLVFVIDENGRARMRVVAGGPETDSAIEVLAGLSKGEAVIVAPPDSLADGRAVRTAGGRP